MAGNFWQSSHYQQWLLDKQDLQLERSPTVTLLDEDEYKKVMIFYINFIQALGEQLKLRQQVIATGTVYFKRFYSRNPLKAIDPLLIAPTTIFLATKVEEFGVISNSRFLSAIHQLIKLKYQYAIADFSYKIQSILECEFYLMEMMDCCLVVFHPYRCMFQYITDLFGFGDEHLTLSVVWRLINDSYRTDVCLLNPPYLIAIACIQVACAIQKRNTGTWFAELNCDMQKVAAIARELVNLYEFCKSYDEKKDIQGILAKMAKPNKASSRSSSSQEVVPVTF